jgi:outer membrane receptor for ferrienterochelin and colicin
MNASPFPVNPMTSRAAAMVFSRPTIALLALLGFACAAGAQRVTPPDTARRPATEESTLDLEQLMKIEVVFAASKRAQQTRDVPSFVSVVTAADIAKHGYRTLADVLKTLPSFYVSNDRNYSYVGVRGFQRPGDWNSRILLLLNGLRTNENVYDLSYLGEESIVDVDMVERIEVIRGPSAALYGSNAFFAVINVVTKKGAGLHGGEVATTAASYGTYAGRASWGQSFASDLDVAVSAAYSDSKGRRLYFPEFDDPATNNGIADGVDHESSRKLLATASKGDFSFQASNVSREKGIPTGSFQTVFNDKRSRTVDGLTLASASYNRSFADSGSFTTRLHAGRYNYTGEYVYDARATIRPNQDEVTGEWWGVDVDAGHAVIARHFLTVGGEFRDNVTQVLKNYDPEPYVLYTDLNNNSTRWGVFAQDEIKLFQPLTLYAGVRYDRYESFGSATSPRVGLIFAPGRATTLKLLAGRAFRAPNEYELHFATTGRKPNPLVQPERIETLELVAERFIGGGLQLSASGFRNRLSALLGERIDPADSALYFDNLDKIESRGVELGLEMNRGHGITGDLTYSLQHTEDRATRVELTSSPRQMVKLLLRAPLGLRAAAAVDAQYMGEQTTQLGNTMNGYTLTNLSLFAPLAFGRFDLSATLYNVFDVTAGTPTSDMLQDILRQDGRSFRVRTTLHF